MELTGRHMVNAASSKIWSMLMDTDMLAKIVPGVSSLEKTGDNSFKSILEIKLGPVNSSFTGNLEMEEITEQKGFVLKLMQNSKIGNASGAIKINLLPVDAEKTEIAFNGDVKLSGLLAGMGQRVMGSVANTLTKKFFANLEKELKTT
ncbi:MAG: SRPBCC domain-containing protein [Ginsengibacter sp.]